MSYRHATRDVPTVQAFAQLVSSSQARTGATGKCNTVINIPWRIITGHFFQILPLIFTWTQQEITKKILSPEAVEAFLKKTNSTKPKNSRLVAPVRPPVDSREKQDKWQKWISITPLKTDMTLENPHVQWEIHPQMAVFQLVMLVFSGVDLNPQALHFLGSGIPC